MMKTALLAISALLLSMTIPWAQEASAKPVASLEQSKLGKMVSSVKLQKVADREFKEAKLGKVPEYYILYFSASW